MRKPVIVERILYPHEWAFQALESLRDSDVLHKEGVKAFYYAISLIMREYIERRFQIHAPSQTTDEFLAGIQKTPVFSDQNKVSLSNFMSSCDMVKYAGEEAGDTECAAIFQATSRFVQDTMIVEAVAPEQPAATIEPTKNEPAIVDSNESKVHDGYSR